MRFVCQNESCGNEFEASKYWARYCSDACRVAAYERRKKAIEKPHQKSTVDSLSVSLNVNKGKP
jgi:hypothetical protein